MASIFKDKAVMTVLIDAVVTLTTYFAGKYAGASAQDIITFVGVWQVVTTALVAHYISQASNETKVQLAKLQAALDIGDTERVQAFLKE